MDALGYQAERPDIVTRAKGTPLMPTHRTSLGVVLLLTAGLAAAQTFQMPKTEIESDPKTDFSTFKTFRWKDSQVPAENPVVHTSVTVYVERGLAGHGL